MALDRFTPTDKKYDVIVAGHLCLDLTPKFPDLRGGDFRQIFRPGKLIEVGDATISTGGAVSNTGLALHKLGLKTLLMTKVNEDAFGRLIEDMLRSQGAQVSIKRTEKDQTSYTVVINPPQVDRIFLHCPGTNATFSREDIDYDACGQARLFHLGYPTLMERLYANRGHDLIEILKRVRDAGCITSVDMTLPDPDTESGKADWKGILTEAMPYIDIFVPSVEEAIYMLQPERYRELQARADGSDIINILETNDLEVLGDEIIRAGAGIAFIKVSHRGCYVHTGGAKRLATMSPGWTSVNAEEWRDRELWQPAFSAPTFASATGAGDAAIAGFLGAFMRGKSPAESLRFACILGWQNVQVYDAISGAKNWVDTEKDLQGNQVTIPTRLEDSDWIYSAEEKVWAGPRDGHVHV